MKMMKKIATVILTICLVLPCFSILTHAADGAIQFVDPETAVGETLELLGVVKKPTGGNLGNLDISITMSYDTEMLKFKSGEGITESEEGSLVYTGQSTNSDGGRKEFVMKFDVLKEGTTKIEIEESTIKNSSGAVLDYTEGSSTITIAEGEGTPSDDPNEPSGETTEVTVDVDGITYTISDKIPENVIPQGYEETTLEYGLDSEISALYNEDTGIYLAYLIDEEFSGKLFMYLEMDATFTAYEEITVSDTVSIILLSDVSEVELPKEYVETTVVVNVDGPSFPAWQRKGETDFCVVYAMNNSGERSLYQLDTVEGTYQRFTAPEVEAEADNSFIGRLSSTLQNHMDYVILVVGLGFLLFVLILIILSVKLYNRNAELDEIYEEYGIDAEDETKDDVIISLGDENEDDVITSLDDEDGDEGYSEDEYEDELEAEMESYVQDGMREVFPEEDDISEIINEVAREDIAEYEVKRDDIELVVEDVVKEEREEETLGAVLKKQVANEADAYYDDDEDVYENFSMDFIDLDD